MREMERDDVLFMSDTPLTIRSVRVCSVRPHACIQVCNSYMKTGENLAITAWCQKVRTAPPFMAQPDPKGFTLLYLTRRQKGITLQPMTSGVTSAWCWVMTAFLSLGRDWGSRSREDKGATSVPTLRGSP